MADPERPDVEGMRSATLILPNAPWSPKVRSICDHTLALERHTDEAASHLRVALLQVAPSDDEIIVGHMRDALALLEGQDA